VSRGVRRPAGPVADDAALRPPAKRPERPGALGAKSGKARVA
jgi:hypothetical protein